MKLLGGRIREVINKKKGIEGKLGGKEEDIKEREIKTEMHEGHVQEKEKELSEEKIDDVVKRMKLGKAAGIDGIPKRPGGLEAQR